VPKTEKAGRVHTSTVAVAILPRPSEVSVTIEQKVIYANLIKKKKNTIYTFLTARILKSKPKEQAAQADNMSIQLNLQCALFIYPQV
jgi:hypothetical protein